MTLKNTYNSLVLAVIAILAMPVLAMAASGMPVFTSNGVSDVQQYQATVMTTFNSGEAVYNYGELPILYVEYMNTVTDTIMISPYNDQEPGTRNNTFTLYHLDAGTQYSYQVVMKYNGSTYRSPAKTFTTRGVVKTTYTPDTAPGTNGTDSTVITVPNVTKPVTTKVVDAAKNTVMTGGATHKNGVAISITDEQARTSVDDSFTFTVKYQNTNSKSLQNAELVIKLPEQYEFVRSTFDMEYNEHDNTVSYIVGRVAPGALKTVTFTARAIGDESTEVKTTATLFYEGGTISASDRDSFHGGSKSVLGASVFGAGFFPQTLWGWLAIIILITVIIIVARRYVVTHPTK